MFYNSGDLGNNVQINEVDNMSSLLEVRFNSREELIAAVHKIAFMEGYVTVIRRSKPDKCVYVGCDRGGQYRDTRMVPLEKRQRKTASRLINCPYEIVGRRKPEGFWMVDVKNLTHNHEPSRDMSGHPYSRRFSEEEIMKIKEMSKAGIPPRQILSSLRLSNPGLQAIFKNIYNEKNKILKENLAGRTIIQALLEELGQAGFSYDIEHDQDGRLTHLMFAHPLSIALTKSYTNVFVMDCTYKTNKYKMPLLDIVGVTSFNTSFYSCFVFMQKEEEDDYIRALTLFSRILGADVHPLVIISDRELALMNAINIVFPRTANILCVWHIEKCIAVNCKKHITEEAHWVAFISTWTALINSHDETTFNEAWSKFEVEYKQKVVVLDYIKATWLPLKEKFVAAWTGKVAHFGNRATSRGEGAHSILKKYLQVSSGGLSEVKEKICLAIENQFAEIKARLSSEKIRHPHHVRIPFFEELITHISVYALDQLHKQYELAKSSKLSIQCKGQFYRTMGLPCAHMIREQNFQALQLNSIHDQWRIDTRAFDQGASMDEGDEIDVLLSEVKSKYTRMPLTEKDNAKRKLTQFLGTSPLLLEPNVQPHKGRPLGSKNKKEVSSTKRDPSAFEIMEKKARKCSHCHNGGHDIRTCQLKDKAPPFASPS